MPSLVVEEQLANRVYPLSFYFASILEESGYFHIQATKPDTIGTLISYHFGQNYITKINLFKLKLYLINILTPLCYITGVSLSDSPSGLLAYILEKFSTGTCLEHRSRADGGLGFRFKKEQLIDNLMMYWASNSITTSMRLYAEESSRKNQELNLHS